MSESKKPLKPTREQRLNAMRKARSALRKGVLSLAEDRANLDKENYKYLWATTEDGHPTNIEVMRSTYGYEEVSGVEQIPDGSYGGHKLVLCRIDKEGAELQEELRREGLQAYQPKTDDKGNRFIDIDSIHI